MMMMMMMMTAIVQFVFEHQIRFITRVNTPPLTRTLFTNNLNPSSNRNLMATPSAAQLADENRYLNDELNRVETVLNSTRAEKDELSIRYNALSDRVRDFIYEQPWKMKIVSTIFRFRRNVCFFYFIA